MLPRSERCAVSDAASDCRAGCSGDTARPFPLSLEGVYKYSKGKKCCKRSEGDARSHRLDWQKCSCVVLVLTSGRLVMVLG